MTVASPAPMSHDECAIGVIEAPMATFGDDGVQTGLL